MSLEMIKDKLKKMLAERLNMDPAEIDASDDDPLFGNKWGIDSVDIIDIVLGIEEYFGIRIKQDQDVEKHFTSLNTLASYIQDLLTQEAVAA